MKVQELLSSEDKWTQKVIARNKNEEPITLNSPHAVKWCLLGAVIKCYPLETYKIKNKVEEITKISIEKFNDSHSYEEVMELVRMLDL